MKLDFHTHKFTYKNLGNNYIEKVGAFLERRIESSRLFMFFLKVLNPFSTKDNLDYISNYLREQSKPAAQKVEENQKWLKERYPDEDWGINILTVDFDHMKCGTPKEKFRRQLADAVAIKYKNEYNKTHVKVFIGIDPRNTDHISLLQIYIDKVDGIKMYCYNGFFPYDDRLDLVYKFAEIHNKPILFHCSDTNINYYRGSDIKELLKKSKFPLLPNRKGNKELSTNFCNPLGYEYVIKKYPKNKFVIAHWGGCSMFNDDVTRIIKENINGFGDVSYFCHSNEGKQYILRTIKEVPEIINKMIFGSDDFMIEVVGGKETVFSLQKYLSVKEWDIITTNWEKLYS